MRTLSFIIVMLCLLLPANVLFDSFFLSLFLCQNQPAGREDSLTVVFWNLENFFDWKADSLSESPSDKEFSSFGKKHWTRKRFRAKCEAVAKAFLWIKDKEGNLPDVIGLAEVENRFVLKRLLSDTQLYKFDYEIVHYDSPDPRGIDVALLYRRSRLKPLSSAPLRVRGPDSTMRTRDILLAEFLLPCGDSIAFLVNHHPSKYGGKTGRKREVALHRLRDAADSLEASGFMNILAMGDFNDVPENPAFGILTEAGRGALVNLAVPLSAAGEGTIRYSGRWDMIDMFFASSALVRNGHIHRMEILRIPFLMSWDSAHSGEKPLRTYSGPRYIGGVSDHCPIMVKIE